MPYGLLELVDSLEVPGSLWLIGLPGNGSNTGQTDHDPFAQWPQVLVEAAQEFSAAVYEQEPSASNLLHLVVASAANAFSEFIQKVLHSEMNNQRPD